MSANKVDRDNFDFMRTLRNSQFNPNYKRCNKVGGHINRGNKPATGKKTEVINGLLHQPCPHVFLVLTLSKARTN